MLRQDRVLVPGARTDEVVQGPDVAFSPWPSAQQTQLPQPPAMVEGMEAKGVEE